MDGLQNSGSILVKDCMPPGKGGWAAGMALRRETVKSKIADIE